jgi:hypothetical protein
MMNPKSSSRNQPEAGSWKLTVVVSDFSGAFPPTGIYYRLPLKFAAYRDSSLRSE